MATKKTTKKQPQKKVTKKSTVIKQNSNGFINYDGEHIKIENLGILIQLVLSAVLIMFVIYSIFITEFYNLTVGILTALSFTMAYNNKNIYNRKNFTTIYCIIGIAGIAFLIGTLF